jgi:hypothetical protein
VPRTCSGERSGLVAGLGLTSAPWQILGAIAEAIGRSRSPGSRATWAPIVKTCSGSSMTLHKEGLVAFEASPHHRRAQLVILTDRVCRRGGRPERDSLRIRPDRTQR